MSFKVFLLSFFGIVWEVQVLIVTLLFNRISLWGSCPVLDFCFLRVLKFIFNFSVYECSVYIFYFFKFSLRDYTFLRICSFFLHYIIYCHTIAQSISLQPLYCKSTSNFPYIIPDFSNLNLFSWSVLLKSSILLVF